MRCACIYVICNRKPASVPVTDIVEWGTVQPRAVGLGVEAHKKQDFWGGLGIGSLGFPVGCGSLAEPQVDWLKIWKQLLFLTQEKSAAISAYQKTRFIL